MNALSFKLEQKIITFLSPHMCDFFSSLSCLQSVLNSMAFSVRSRLYGCVYCVSLILLRLSVSCFGEVISKINIIQNFPALVQLWAIFTMRFLFERVERRAKLYCRGFDGVTRSSQLLFRSSLQVTTRYKFSHFDSFFHWFASTPGYYYYSLYHLGDVLVTVLFLSAYIKFARLNSQRKKITNWKKFSAKYMTCWYY